MKKYVSRGFTLVELMIVIAIIGILAAVLYPAMTGYFERSRDTNRQGGLRNLSLSLSAYQIDKSEYPTMGSDKCADTLSSALVGGYIQKMPTDPKKNYGVTSCESKGGYGYANVTDASGSGSGYVLAAKMETLGNGNLDANNWGDVQTKQIGKDTLKDVNNKGTLSGNVVPYYVVAQ